MLRDESNRSAADLTAAAMPVRPRAHWQFGSVALACLLVSGCEGLGYGAQAVHGQWQLLAARRPIDALIADAGQPAALRDTLALALEARAFASQSLALPDNGSYRQYADLGRDYAVWTLVVAPAFAVEPQTWCFPVAGCVPYRGFYDKADALVVEQRHRQAGDDVFSGPVTAYSTLGWFDDPVLNTMLRSPTRLVGLIFHELAHQRLYLPGDGAFNESYATAVELTGLARWFESKHTPAALGEWQTERAHEEQVRALLGDLRDQLAERYAAPLPPAEMAEAKAVAIDETRRAYQRLKAERGWGNRFDAWFGERLNNALLAAFNTYHQWVPSFLAVLDQCDGDLAAFHRAVESLAALPQPERTARLTRLKSEPDDPGMACPQTAMAPALPRKTKGSDAMAVPSPRPSPKKGEGDLERAPGATFTVTHTASGASVRDRDQRPLSAFD